jgi:hypothetical protein
MLLLDLDAVFANDRATAGPRTAAGLPPDWRLIWEERAAIMEFDGGLPRVNAERLALIDVTEQMQCAGTDQAGREARA